jgi:hypothetical protein
VCRLIELVGLRGQPEVDKDIEIIVLRHPLEVR